MNLYSVLLVDDEEEVYSVIMKKLDWEAMGFRIAGYARNGVEALEMAEEIQPDVVMTDIKLIDICGQHRFSWTMSVCIAEWEGRKNEQKRSENIL